MNREERLYWAVRDALRYSHRSLSEAVWLLRDRYPNGHPKFNPKTMRGSNILPTIHDLMEDGLVVEVFFGSDFPRYYAPPLK